MHYPKVVLKLKPRCQLLISEFITPGTEPNLLEDAIILSIIEVLLPPGLMARIPFEHRACLEDSVCQSLAGAFSEGELDGLRSITGQSVRGFEKRLIRSEIRKSDWFRETTSVLSRHRKNHFIAVILKAMAHAYRASFFMYQKMKHDTSASSAQVFGEIIFSKTIA